MNLLPLHARPWARLAALLPLWAAGSVLAHTYDVPMGEAAGLTHYAGFICSNDAGFDSDHLVAQVRNNTPGAPAISVVVIKDSRAATTTDAVGGDAQASPAIQVRGGNGVYQLVVHKSGPGALNYSLIVHCMEASGQIHTGTDVMVYQFE